MKIKNLHVITEKELWAEIDYLADEHIGCTRERLLELLAEGALKNTWLECQIQINLFLINKMAG